MTVVDRDPETTARFRLIEAIEGVRAAAKTLGLDVDAIGALYAPWSLRVEAWLWRSSRLLVRREA